MDVAGGLFNPGQAVEGKQAIVLDSDAPDAQFSGAAHSPDQGGGFRAIGKSTRPEILLELLSFLVIVRTRIIGIIIGGKLVVGWTMSTQPFV